MTGLEFYPLLCVSVSKIQKDDDTDYIQGAGDDEEAWSLVFQLAVTPNTSGPYPKDVLG